MLTLNVDNESGAIIVPAKHQHVDGVSHNESTKSDSVIITLTLPGQSELEILTVMVSRSSSKVRKLHKSPEQFCPTKTECFYTFGVVFC